MTVHLTDYVARQLADVGIKPDEFIDWFQIWKRAASEWDSYFFGKDGGYLAPPVAGEKYRLRHVHMVPMLDHQARAAWEAAYARDGKRTSDRVLIYVKADNGDFLLIAILAEPDAHDVAEMNTKEDRETMAGFVVVAEEFLTDGSIVI